MSFAIRAKNPKLKHETPKKITKREQRLLSLFVCSSRWCCCCHLAREFRGWALIQRSHNELRGILSDRERERKKQNTQKQPQRTITIPVMTMMLRSSSRSVQSMLARTNRAAIPLRRVASTQSAALLGSQSENGNNGFGDSSSSSWSSSWSRFGAMTTTLAGMSAAFLALQVSRDRKAECCGIAGVVANQQHDAR